jgi:hypothetical protein
MALGALDTRIAQRPKISADARFHPFIPSVLPGLDSLLLFVFDAIALEVTASRFSLYRGCIK